ncbi:MAG: hypothetical protein ACJ75H_13150 [Thermoanaerobaculia bacterium]
MNQPDQKSAAASITGTFYIHFLDGMPPHPLAKADRLDISRDEVVILRDGKEVDRLAVDADSTNRWGRARNLELVIEYLKYDHAGRTDLLFGRMGRNPVAGANEDPPVGVWGADSQPPKGGDDQG